MKKPLWKKWWVWILALLVLICFVNLYDEEETDTDINKTDVKKSEMKTEEKGDEKEDGLNLKEIFGKEEEEVNDILGEPSSREETEFRLAGTETKVPAVSSFYNDGMLEIMFIEGAPQRITYTPKETFKFPDDIEKAIRTLGFKESNVENQNDFVTNLKIDGVYETSIFNSDGKINMIYLIKDERFK